MDLKQIQPGTPPVKKHKSSHHHHQSDKKSKKHKHSKHHSSSHSEGSKLVSIKKEIVTPVKKKPMISESDSDDGAPLPLQQMKVIKSDDASLRVDQEGERSMPDVKPQLPDLVETKVKRERTNGSTSDTIPLVMSTGLEATTRSKCKTMPKYKVPQIGKKRKIDSDGPEDKYEEDDDEKDSDFKPSSAKKPKVSPARKKAASPSPIVKKRKSLVTSSHKKPTTSTRKKSAVTDSPVKDGRKKKEEPAEVWKWWEEKPHPDGIKWITLDHRGPCFAPPYEPLPSNVKFVYDGEVINLLEPAEEAAGFFAKMLDHDYTKKEIFCTNFFQDWRKEMSQKEATKITNFSKCDFTRIHQYYMEKAILRKAMTKEEKLQKKEENEQAVEEYGWCIIDRHRERIGNFRIEPPGLFRGRGDHPKQGRIKKRIQAEDVQINIGKEAKVPSPPAGHRWKQVLSDNSVTWLASWTENIQGGIKYVMLNPTSRLKGEKDWAKYEVARRLKLHVEKIRSKYMEDLKSKEMRIRQRAVAMYFIDKLALRAGNEKDSDESADTVGCCSIRMEHVKKRNGEICEPDLLECTTAELHEEKDGKEFVIEFDFLGKDSIRYYNCVPVLKQVFKNVRLFLKDKNVGDDLFDRLTTALLNKHLSELMEGLTAKVFRTYNASKTLQEQLDELTCVDDLVTSKILSYNRANRAVAILCNHQRATPKSFEQQMSNMQAKIQTKEDTITETIADIKSLKKEARATKDSKITKKLEAKTKQLARLKDQLLNLEVQATDKQENKEIALGTSKLNYLDPRISVAWCKKWSVPLEKVYNRTQRQKFAWAIDMTDEDFIF